MKDMYKNPVLYYILVPCIAALWPLLVWAVYLPAAENGLKKGIAEYKAAQVTIESILELDSTRLENGDPNKAAEKFDYATAVSDIARRCKNIPATSYTVSSKPVRVSGGKKSHDPGA